MSNEFPLFYLIVAVLNINYLFYRTRSSQKIAAGGFPQPQHHEFGISGWQLDDSIHTVQRELGVLRSDAWRAVSQNPHWSHVCHLHDGSGSFGSAPVHVCFASKFKLVFFEVDWIFLKTWLSVVNNLITMPRRYSEKVAYVVCSGPIEILP